MITIIICMFLGIGTGFILHRKNLSFIHQVITVLIWSLLFFLGLEVGGNTEIVHGFHNLGVEAIIHSLGATTGSVLAAWYLWKKANPQPPKQENKKLHKGEIQLKEALTGSLIIISFFIAGIFCSLLHLINYDVGSNNISLYALYMLIFSVGISIGCNPLLFKEFKQVNPKLMLLPIATILGSFMGSFVVYLLIEGRSISDCLAIGSGFGYYSLSSVFITEYKGAELGTIALLANIVRELITLLAAPLLVKYFGNLAPISAGGATTMDTTLPIITQTSGEKLMVVSIYHGFIVDFSVPILVTLFCTF